MSRAREMSHCTSLAKGDSTPMRSLRCRSPAYTPWPAGPGLEEELVSMARCFVEVVCSLTRWSPSAALSLANDLMATPAATVDLGMLRGALCQGNFQGEENQLLR